ncbi:MAG: SH3 domain-containing protein [Anaerolineales bacterium]|nr:SH3 domain-containing protein [Anaerolineales bacterium]
MKRIIILLALLAFVAGLYAMSASAATVKPTATATAQTCEVETGYASGAVNLRTCAGTMCEVIRVLTEGDRLTVNAIGAWLKVTTADGVTGYIKSNYCKGK